MPYPAQVTIERIVDAAAELIESGGVEQLTLARLAVYLGIKAPSLYHHFNSKAALLRAVNLQTMANLTRLMNDIEADHHDLMMAAAMTYRAYAHAHPALYLLAFHPDPTLQPAADLLLAQAIPLQTRIAALSGQIDSLAALRGLWALLHGFVVLELSARYQRPGDIDAAFTYAVRAYLKGVQSSSSSNELKTLD